MTMLNLKFKFNIIAIIVLLMMMHACGNNNSKNTSSTEISMLKNRLDSFQKVQNQLETNKKLVTDFYQEVVGNKNVQAIDKYIADDYIQHNPVLSDGKKALKEALTAWYKAAPKETIDVHHLSAEGNLVYIHTKSKEHGKIVSIIDIFRIGNNKIVEHWDVIQPVPEKSANPHPMF